MAKLKSVLKLVFFLGIGLLLLWMVVKDLSKDDKTSIYAAFQKANYLWLIFSMFLGVLSNVSRAIRWKMLMAPLGYNPKLSNTFFAVSIAYLANLVFPRLGEVSRCGILTKYEKIPFNEGFGTVIAERAIDMLILILIFFITLIFQMNKIWGMAEEKFFNPLQEKIILFTNASILYVIVGFLVLSFVLFFTLKKKKLPLTPTSADSPKRNALLVKISNIIMGFWNGLKTIKNIRSPFKFIAHSIFIWLLYLVMLQMCFYSFKETSQLTMSEGLTVFIFGSLGLIFVPGGIGAYHKLVIDSLALYSIPFYVSFAFAWMVWSSQLILILLSGLLSLILLPLLNKTRNEQA